MSHLENPSSKYLGIFQKWSECLTLFPLLQPDTTVRRLLRWAPSCAFSSLSWCMKIFFLLPFTFICSLECILYTCFCSTFSEEEQTLTVLEAKPVLNIFNHSTPSAFLFMTCQRISIITHEYSPTGYSASESHLFVHQLVWFHHKPKLWSDQRVASGCVALNGSHSYAGGYYKWLDQVSSSI